MSLNIQTSTGLLEISTKVTKDKVISALGYSPANEEVETTVDNHINDADIHITSEERILWTENVEDLDAHKSDKTVHVTSSEKQTWDNKSDFSGAYADLIDAPNITEDNSGNMIVADQSGNIIMRVDEDGVATTHTSAKTIALNGEDLGSRLDSLESLSLPNILDNESGDLTISDENGNAIVKIDESGLETTIVTAKSAIIGGEDVIAKMDEHIDDSVAHITSSERTKWNNKSDLGHTHDFGELTNSPIEENNSGELVYTDESGNIIARINENGTETTTLTAKSVVVGGVNVQTELDELNNLVGTKSVATQISEAIAKENLSQYATDSDLSTHISNTTVHITSAERTSWNAKANQSDFEVHVDNQSNPHGVTKSQVGLGNVDNTSDINKPVSTAQQTALNNLKTELSESIVSESKEWTVVDEDGYVVAKIGEGGLETTTVTAKSVVVNGTNVETKLNGLQTQIDTKANSSVLSNYYTKTEIDSYEFITVNDIDNICNTNS